MNEIIRQILLILRGTWERRWVGLAVMWAIGVIGGLLVWRMPDQYESSARVYVDTQSVLKPLMVGLTVQPNVEQQVALLSSRLISRPNVSKLVSMAGLDVGVQSEREKAALIDSVMHRLKIETSGKDNIYTLTFRDVQPQRAQRVVESLATIFIDSNRRENRSDSTNAKQFIDEQIKVYEAKLSEAESKLKDFRLRHLGLSDGGKDYFLRMEELSNRIKETQLELREAENSRDALTRQMSGEDPMVYDRSDATQNDPVSEIDARIDALKRNLDGLLQKFTEEHPDVVGTKRVIAQLEEQRRREIAAREKLPPSKRAPSGSSNPVYREIKVSLAKAEANIASLRVRVSELQERYQQLRDSARMVPQVEAEFAQLNRDYDVNKKNYEALVSRRESAEISGEMETTAGLADFRVVDPPTVSGKPVWPNRLLLLPLVLIGAMGAGIATSFGVSKLWPTFHDGAGLREVAGIPVLGAISFKETDVSRRHARRGLLAFASAVASLVIAYAAGLAFLIFVSLRAV